MDVPSTVSQLVFANGQSPGAVQLLLQKPSGNGSAVLVTVKQLSPPAQLVVHPTP